MANPAAANPQIFPHAPDSNEWNQYIEDYPDMGDDHRFEVPLYQHPGHPNHGTPYNDPFPIGLDLGHHPPGLPKSHCNAGAFVGFYRRGRRNDPWDWPAVYGKVTKPGRRKRGTHFGERGPQEPRVYFYLKKFNCLAIPLVCDYRGSKVAEEDVFFNDDIQQKGTEVEGWRAVVEEVIEREGNGITYHAHGIQRLNLRNDYGLPILNY